MIDASLILSGTVSGGTITGQAVTATAASTNVLDQGTNRDMGAGDDIYFVFTITETFLTLTSLQIGIQSSADNSAWVNILLSPVIVAAALLAGTVLVYTLPRKQLNDPAGGTPNRYLRANYTVAGADATAGKIICDIRAAKDAEAQQSYPIGYTTVS